MQPKHLIFKIQTSWDTTSCDLPEDETKAVHVCHDVWLKMTFIQRLVQNLWRHVPLCTDFSVGWDVNLIGVTGENSDQRTHFKLNVF